MKKNLKILIIGFGSIGARHCRNLQDLGFKNLAAYDIDTQKISDAGISVVPRLDEKILREFDVAFICNPTDVHLKTALLCAKAGLHLFIEKPLSHSVVGIAALKEIIRKRRLTAMVACNFRFHPGFQRLEEIVRSGKFGKPLSARLVMGHDLSKSRGGVDYRKTYAASKFGGGVIFDSGSHAVDYLSVLFGSIVSLDACYGNISALGIEAEDYTSAILEHDSGLMTTLELDYFSKPKRHNLEVQFENGWAKWDFAGNRFLSYNDHTKETFEEAVYKEASPEIMRNDMYFRELKYFLSKITADSRDVACGVKEGGRVVEVLTAIKKSGKTGKKVII